MNDFDYYESVEKGRRIESDADRRKTVTGKGKSVRNVIAAVVVAGYYVLLIGGYFFFDGTSVFYRSLNPFSGAGNPNKAIRIASYVIFFMSVSMVSRFLLDYVMKTTLSSKKMGKAIQALLSSLIRYLAFLAMVLLSLNTLGVDALSIVAGLGVLSLIIGMGVKELISDIVAGLFIVFEQLFDMGDIITVGGFRGTVVSMGIRTTQIQDEGGNKLIVNNSRLGNVVNMTESLSVAMLETPIKYGESLERVERILAENLPVIGKEIPELKEGPFYVGVSGVGKGSMTLRFVAKCEEGAKYRVERAMTRRFKLLWDEKEIESPLN